MRPTIMLLGATGQLGTELARVLPELGAVVTPTRHVAPLHNPDALRSSIRRAQPALVVNAAAYTAVDRAEGERDLARAVNEIAPRVIAEECSALGSLLVHYSTDYVFDGESISPYSEQVPAHPLNVYGETKLAGELAIAATGAQHLIFRTSWLYGAGGHNFLRTMLRLAHERLEIRVVSDQTGSPTSISAVASATMRILGMCRHEQGFALPAHASGTYHMTAAGEATWHEFASAIIAADPQHAEQRCRSIVPISTAEYPTPAQRPRYSVMDNTRLASTFGVTLASWQSQLVGVMRALGSSNGVAAP